MLNKFLATFLLTCSFACSENPVVRDCAPEDFDCYDKVCKDAKDEFRCVIGFLPTPGLVGSQYFDDVFGKAVSKASPCVNEKTTAAFFETLALMQTTGYYLDGELAESVPFIVGNLCLSSMRCLESAFKSANLGARNIIMEELEYRSASDDETFGELTECRNKLNAFLKANKIEFNSTAGDRGANSK
jgi:hypothetical protein